MKLSTFLIALFAMIFAFSFLTWQRLKFDVEKELSVNAEGINREAPVVINPYTDIIGAHAEGKEIVYQFRMHGFNAKDMPHHRDALLEEKISRAKSDENFARLLRSGARLSYEYFVGDELALRFSVDQSSIDENG